MAFAMPATVVRERLVRRCDDATVTWRHDAARRTFPPMPHPKFPNLTVLDHPLIQHKLSILRDKNTTTKDFKQLVNEIAMLMAYEVTKDLPLETAEVETPLEPIDYYFKIPSGEDARDFFVLDPMLATGGSAADAVKALKHAGAQRIRFLCLVAAPEGVRRMLETHPDVPVFAAALDRELNDHGYILPGRGRSLVRYPIGRRSSGLTFYVILLYCDVIRHIKLM